ncbi:MAG: hypothetical protein F7C07_00735 [Desulfurococcales archaeon]|nr:hypothetical protein [Desulfurococcales archaeon]
MKKCIEDIKRLIDEIYARTELLESRLTRILSDEEPKGSLSIIAIINELYDKLAELRYKANMCEEARS